MRGGEGSGGRGRLKGNGRGTCDGRTLEDEKNKMGRGGRVEGKGGREVWREEYQAGGREKKIAKVEGKNKEVSDGKKKRKINHKRRSTALRKRAGCKRKGRGK